ncbi:hypothetical protein CDAR_381111 [Caerostris darwini]|uniref:DNA-directed DNA polymerase n=1 Tax=Caerostris darwini TaxID=1538125 RepID=A0AAV4UU97_9ARAC|nr:hypothetical protein CDAR_381111 [Caerostris darwini]
MQQTACTHSNEERSLIGTWLKNIYLPSEEVATIQCQSCKDQDTSTNIFIAAFSTAWARLKLYQEMDKLDENVLYHDKDGITYASDGKNDLPPDNSLGEFTNELERDEITTITCKTLYFPP